MYISLTLRNDFFAVLKQVLDLSCLFTCTAQFPIKINSCSTHSKCSSLFSRMFIDKILTNFDFIQSKIFLLELRPLTSVSLCKYPKQIQRTECELQLFTGYLQNKINQKFGFHWFLYQLSRKSQELWLTGLNIKHWFPLNGSVEIDKKECFGFKFGGC